MLQQGAQVSDEQLHSRSVQVSVEDRMMLAYTSGTTGHPKGSYPLPQAGPQHLRKSNAPWA